MSITLTANEAESKQLISLFSLDSDPGTRGAAFILLYSDNTIKVSGGIYSEFEGFRPQRLKHRQTSILRSVVENTWLDKRNEMPEEPLAATITTGNDSASTMVEYYFGSASKQWELSEANAQQLFAKLAP